MKRKVVWTAIVLSLFSPPLESHAMFNSFQQAARQIRQFPQWVRQVRAFQPALHPTVMRVPGLPPVSLQRASLAEVSRLRDTPSLSFFRNSSFLPKPILTLRDSPYSFHRSFKLRTEPQRAQLPIALTSSPVELDPSAAEALIQREGQSREVQRDEKTPTESVLLLDGPISEADEYLKDHLIQVDESYQKAAFDQIRKLIVDKSTAGLEHAHYVGYLLTRNQNANRVKIIPRLFYQSQSIYQHIHEAYEKGCRLANLSISIDIVRADLSQFSHETLELGRRKLSEPLVEHLAGHLLNVMEALSEEKLSVEGRDQWLAFTFKVLNEDQATFQQLSDSSGLSSYAVEFLKDFKEVAESQIIPEFYALGGDQLEAAIVDHPDMLFVMASGNEGYDLEKRNPFKPVIQDKKYDNVLVVASSDESGALSSFSNYGESTVHLATQGQDVDAMTVYGANRQISGTSFAVPQVVRLIAEMRLIRPSLQPAQIKAILEKTVQKRPELQNRLIWGGLLDEKAALIETTKSL